MTTSEGLVCDVRDAAWAYYIGVVCTTITWDLRLSLTSDACSSQTKTVKTSRTLDDLAA